MVGMSRFCQGGQVLRQVAAGEDAAMDLGMQGLDASVEHFRKAGVIADFRHGQTRFPQQPAVPPVDSSFTPCAASPWANSRTPRLSETEINAC